LRQGNNGGIYGITYVDFKTKCVFNGSDLGKEFSAKGLLEQLGSKQEIDVKINKEQINEVRQGNIWQQHQGTQRCQEQNHEKEYDHWKENIVQLLLKPEKQDNSMLIKCWERKGRKGNRID
jgi:hypothetical protein